MNYRHIYHAGNFADVFKHGLLCVLLSGLTKKDKPLTYLETHAGCGLYDLKSIEATKTAEFQKGIVKLIAQTDYPESLKPLIDLVKQLNQNNEKNHFYYPGSPLVAANCLRETDKIILCELHPEDVSTLKRVFKRFSYSPAIHHCDGYQGLKALTPPTPRRGLVLIDPPFEKETEIKDLVNGVKIGLERWPNATYVIWYPIKNSDLHEQLIKKIKALKIPFLNPQLIVDFDKSSTRLIGTGMIILNVPFGCEQAVVELTNYLSCRLG